MRLGPLEIVLIIAVIIAVAVIARIIRTGRAAGQGKSNPEAPTNQPESNRLWGFLNRTGIVMVVAGVATLIAAVGLFRWVLQSYLWAVIIMAIGFILVLFARKKR